MAPANVARDYYAILEVSRSATNDVIKASYRRLALLHHPDKNGGAHSATIKTQLLNEAWEILGDSEKKREYDNKTRFQTGTSYPTQPTPPPQEPKPQPRPQPQPQPQAPQPDRTAEEELKAKAKSQKARQDWLHWERLQEQLIRHSRNRVKKLETEVAALNAKIDANHKKLADNEPYWWNVLASLSTRLTETEKNNLRRENIGSEHAANIKGIPLARERLALEALEKELATRRAKEESRLAQERYAQEERERVRQQKAQAEAQRRRAEAAAKEREEFLAKTRAAAEARAKAEKKRAEAWAKQAKERAAANEKAARERAAAEQQRAKEALRQQEAARKAREQAAEKTRQEAARQSRCSHKMWWNRIGGQHTCRHCTKTVYKFAMQCQGCNTIGCAECMRTLKAGRVPAVDTSSHTRSNGARGPRRARPSRREYEKDEYVPPSPPSPPSYHYDDNDYYD